MNPFRRESDRLTPTGAESPTAVPAHHERLSVGSESDNAESLVKRESTSLRPAVRHLYLMGMSAIIASRSMQRVMEKVEKVARTDSTVLIGGESGVGKELIARAIHHYSPRRERPFVDLNCAAFPENLIESELFGYEKGAFSGADNVKLGMFETASGGTLFLDEIGELDTRMQPKLLRVLDGYPYYRLGGARKVQSTARVVTATNAGLEDAVRRGRFRSDLYHRLDAIQLHVPPLRERIEDIGPLCELFLQSTGCSLREDAVALLQDYSWPGNIRELRNVLNKAVVFAEGTELTPADLPADIRGKTAPTSGYSLERIEEQTILRALDQTGGHQQKAADILGISRRTLIRKLKTYGSVRTHGGASHSAGRGKSGPGVGL